MSAQLPPEVDAIVTTAVGDGLDMVLAVVPDKDKARDELLRWARALVADIIAPPVRVTADEDAEVKVTVR